MTELLKDQVSIITGGTAGIGKAIAIKFVEEGATVLIFGSHAERGAQVVNEIKHLHCDANIHFYQVDVSNGQLIADTIKSILEAYGHVDILVNNAGITRDQLLMKMTDDDWDSVMLTNLKSCFHTCKAVTRAMLKAKKGKIINVSSVVGVFGNPGQTNYAASKAGMIGFTKSLAKELATRQICVNCIAPGFVDTQMTESLTTTQRESALNQIPMGRFGKPDEIAKAALFLASNLSDYVTGQVIAVDGGLLMG
ncbi:MAG: 3-oxoacyl-ACP reductase FabG [Parachlamydiaceae bacterium]|nr:3-oxoacyl-ACP reductase FabG [Parachlamydiaceae bacterium]